MEVLPEIIHFSVLELKEERTAERLEYVASSVLEGMGSNPTVSQLFWSPTFFFFQSILPHREGIEPTSPALGDCNFLQAQTN